MFRAMKLCTIEVISINDGRRLGFIHDVEIDETDGSIKSVIVKPKGKWGFFGRGESVVEWSDIRVWGKDLVLVEKE